MRVLPTNRDKLCDKYQKNKNERMKDLTTSTIDRQNILNNRFALQKIQEYIGFSGMLF